MGRPRPPKLRVTQHEEEVLYGREHAKPRSAGAAAGGGGGGGVVSAHNLLDGLQGGDAPYEYYHLDASDYGDLTDANAQLSALHTDGSPTFADIVAASLTVANSGIHLLDTNASHDLIFAVGSDLSADRILTLTTGDAARTITLSGNPTLDDWFDQALKQASNPLFNSLILEGGTHDTTLDAGTPSEAVTYTLPAADGAANEVLATDSNGVLSWIDASGIAAGVEGPGSSTDHAIVRWDGTGGDTLQDTANAILTDAGLLTLGSNLIVDGGDIGVTADSDILQLASGTLTVNGLQTITASTTGRLLSILGAYTPDGNQNRGAMIGFGDAGDSIRTQIGHYDKDTYDLTGTSGSDFFIASDGAINLHAGSASVANTPTMTLDGTEVHLQGDLLPMTAGGTDLGAADKELGDVFVATDKYIYFGNGQEAKMSWDSGATAFRIEVQ